MALASMKTQYWPPPPKFTQKDVGPQAGKVFIVSGGNQGVGLELIKMLYPTGATIYMASRSKERAEQAIKDITSKSSSHASNLKFLHLDLDDLANVRVAAKTFADQESRLDILRNNAGIGAVPAGSKTKQGIEAHQGVNVIGSLLFTQLLLPQLRAAAASSPKNSVRVVWTSSMMMENTAPPGGYNLQDIEKGGTESSFTNYATSKAANWILAVEAGARWGGDGILSVCQNPGNLKTNIYHTQPKLMMFFVNALLHPPKKRAYTELFAGLSDDITEKEQGCYIIPWGRIQSLNQERTYMTRWRRIRARSCGTGAMRRLRFMSKGSR